MISIFTSGNSQPQGSSACITELFFDDNGEWTLELRFDYFDTRDTGYLLVSPSDTGFFRKFPDSAGFVVISNNDLDQPFTINYNGDYLAVLNPMHDLAGYGRMTEPFFWGNYNEYTNVVNPPGPGQSIVRLNNLWHDITWDNSQFLVIDTSHSPGYLTWPATGTVQGYLYDSTGTPLPFMGVCLDGRDAEYGDALYLWSDANGYFCDTSLLTKNFYPYIQGQWYPINEYFTISPGGITQKNYTVPIGKELTIEGTCLLNKSDSHEGIRIIFDNKCPGIEPDTVYTDSTGYFSHNPTPGIYSIVYAYDGYIPAVYSLNYNLIRSEVFYTQTLAQGEINIIPSGPVSGTWSDPDPYWILGDISVNPEDSLIIKAGVKVKVFANCAFNIFGTIITEGSYEENAEIELILGYFHNGMSFRGEQSSGSRLDFTRFKSTGYITFMDSSPDFSHVTFDNFGPHIHIYRSSAPVFEHCRTSQSTFSSFFAGDNTAPVFRNCTFIYSRLIIRGHSAPVIDYNDFYKGNSLIQCYDYSNPSITGNIFLLGECGIDVCHSNGLEKVGYNSFFGLYTPGRYTGLPGLGQLDTINVNGDSCDIYFNITKHPRLVDPENEDFNLLFNSPCIDAGDPLSNHDPDSTIADIGAIYYDQLTIITEPIIGESCIVNIFPNPSYGLVNFQITLPEQYLSKKGFINIYNLNGVRVGSYSYYCQNPLGETYNYPDINFKPGTYFYELVIEGNILSNGKLILLAR